LNQRNRIWVILFISLAAILHVRVAVADEFRLMPNLRLTEEYNDNIFLSATGRIQDFTTTTSPGLELYDSTERFHGNLSSRAAWLVYANNPGFDHIDQFHSGNGSYQLTPSLALNAGAAYSVDSRPDRALPTTGLVVESTVPRRTESFTGGADYTLTEKSGLSFSYGYAQSVYLSSQPQTSNYTTNSAQISLSHDLESMLKNTKGQVTFSYINYDYQNRHLSVDSYSGTVGATKTLSEKLSVSINAGAVQTISNVESLNIFGFPEKEKLTSLGFTGMGSLAYRGEKTDASISASQQVLPSPGSAGTTNRTSLAFSADHRFTYELSGTFFCQYFLNKSTQTGVGVQQIDQVSFSISPGLRYEFTRDFFLEGTYTYTRIDDNVNNTSASRNLFMLRLTMQTRLFE